MCQKVHPLDHCVMPFLMQSSSYEKQLCVGRIESNVVSGAGEFWSQMQKIWTLRNRELLNDSKKFNWIQRDCLGSGCSIKALWSGWIIVNRNVFLTALQARKSMTKAATDSAVWWGVLCIHIKEWNRELSGVSFVRALISFMRVPPPKGSTSKNH